MNHKSIQEFERYNSVTPVVIQVEMAKTLLRQTLRLRRIENALHVEGLLSNNMCCPIYFCGGQETMPAVWSLYIDMED